MSIAPENVEENQRIQKEESNEITEKYSPYTDIPMNFNDSITDKKFNSAWEDYLSKNPQNIARVI